LPWLLVFIVFCFTTREEFCYIYLFPHHCGPSPSCVARIRLLFLSRQILKTAHLNFFAARAILPKNYR
jgi:hypothetical protein